MIWRVGTNSRNSIEKYLPPWLLKSRFNSWNRMILRFHQGSASWIGSRIETGVDSSDLAQTRASLGRLANLRRVRKFMKFSKRHRFEAELLPYSWVVTPWPCCAEAATHRCSLASSSLALSRGPPSSSAVAASLVLTCAPSFASRHNAKVISPLSPLLSWPNSSVWFDFNCASSLIVWFDFNCASSTGWLCIFHCLDAFDFNDFCVIFVWLSSFLLLDMLLGKVPYCSQQHFLSSLLCRRQLHYYPHHVQNEEFLCSEWW